jgi:hypothetical protein
MIHAIRLHATEAPPRNSLRQRCQLITDRPAGKGPEHDGRVIVQKIAILIKNQRYSSPFPGETGAT